ncbi:IS630 family transposase [Methylomonas montana]|uniref:IS630 family transposase n=1 Tax=Methylomonas montana TaxID=3058963 RepID=UPI0026598C20|nr:IS630 family transposase [Methylomonas montana]WKJ89071.1 IS630 family transposase [Methylomonas montana]
MDKHKIDARKLTVEGRVLLRQMVIRLRKQSGMSLKELAAVAGVHHRTIEEWLARARKGGEGALQEKSRGRRLGSGRKLTMADECWLRDQIVGECPQQLKLPFALWTRPAIKALIRERFGVEMQDRLVGKYLKRWGFTPQRPIKRALEQDPVKVATWLEQTYPQVLARAKAENATILWGDETAVKEDAHWIRGYAPKGQTPVLKTSTRWHKLSMISAISARGELAFQIVEGSINTARFLEFLSRLIEGAPRKIFLVVDNLRVHHAKQVSEWLQDKQERIELVFLPPYAPESNPDEYLNRDFKTALRSGPVSQNTAELLEKALAFMSRIATLPNHVASYFKHPAAIYAAQGI